MIFSLGCTSTLCLVSQKEDLPFRTRHQSGLFEGCRSAHISKRFVKKNNNNDWPEKKMYFILSNIFIYLVIYLWLCWVFVSVRGLSLVTASGGHSSSRCASLSLSRPLLLRSTSSRRAGSVIVAHRPSCSVACGIFPGQGSNPCPLHWQADSQPLHHQGSPHFKQYV